MLWEVPLVQRVLIPAQDAPPEPLPVGPLDAVLLFSRLMAEKFAGTPIGEHYAAAGH